MSDPAAAASDSPSVIQLSGMKYVIGCVIVAAAILAIGQAVTIPVWVLALEVLATILSLFLLGSFKYQIHKNALTYGAVLVCIATFFVIWWPGSSLQSQVTAQGWMAGGLAGGRSLVKHHLLSFDGLDHLIHADTMLFILGLTLFVCVIAQTRLLEGITFFLLRRNKGHVLPTAIAVTAVVSFASGIFDGVSMIGLTIRTLVIILMLAKAPLPSIRYAVMVCTAVTTVCGMWLAYGEPPNLIMKANLIDPVTQKPYLTDLFFVTWCLPAAVITYVCVAFSLKRKLSGVKVELEKLDILDANAATVRFLQAEKHGEVYTPAEFVKAHGSELGDKTEAVFKRVESGQSVGLAMVHEQVDPAIRQKLLAFYTSDELSAKLDEHYILESKGQSPGIDAGESMTQRAINELGKRRSRAQLFGSLAVIPFVGLLIAHGMNHHIPLFFASFAGFFVAVLGIWGIPKMRRLALHEAKHEYAEYYFLFPLFLSITLLTKAGFFDQLQGLIQDGVASGKTLMLALTQFYGATFLSAILDNNVVADFASRALHGLDLNILHLFAMSQIAGYAVGGCWTHIGCAQSVVAFSFIQRSVDERYTPLQWIKEMTPVMLGMILALTGWIVLANYLAHSILK